MVICAKRSLPPPARLPDRAWARRIHVGGFLPPCRCHHGRAVWHLPATSRRSWRKSCYAVFDELDGHKRQGRRRGRPWHHRGHHRHGNFLGVNLPKVAQPAYSASMFGHKSEIRKVKQVDESGNECLKNVVHEVAAIRSKHGHNATPSRSP